jgi:hypothetical protein
MHGATPVGLAAALAKWPHVQTLETHYDVQLARVINAAPLPRLRVLYLEHIVRRVPTQALRVACCAWITTSHAMRAPFNQLTPACTHVPLDRAGTRSEMDCAELQLHSSSRASGAALRLLLSAPNSEH